MKRAMKTGDCVRSADGALYRIGYVDVDHAEATLSALEEDGRYAEGLLVTLPLAELTRVVDPKRRRPPIEGMPERKLCAWCQRKLRPFTKDHLEGSRVIRRTFIRWQGYRELFCTTGCAIDFAAASHRAGYRRKGS